MVYFHAQRNSSIEFSCVPPERSNKLFAFSLTREWLKQREVLYHNFQDKPTLKDITFKDRISEQTEPMNQSIHLSIRHLQGYDTDMYMCTFHYSKATGFNNLSGNKFVLYVQDYRKYDFLITPHGASQGQVKVDVAKKAVGQFS